jgi:glycosyltransferase A (GT-A) superfamily protein (DUF2064 family)
VDEWWPQPAGGLGDQLQSGFEMWQARSGPIAAIGTDCLDLDSSLVQTAFEMLREADVVFGPAVDGGYYLVGTARYLPRFFECIPWSTSDTLAVHLSLCRQHEWSVRLLPTRRDIDTWEDWLAFDQRKQENSSSAGSAIAT